MGNRCTMCDVELSFPPWGESGRERTLKYCPRCECQFGYDDTEFTGVLGCRLRCLSEIPEWYYPDGRIPEGLGFRDWVAGMLASFPSGINRDFTSITELREWAEVECRPVDLPQLMAAGVLEQRGVCYAVIRPAELPEPLCRRIIASDKQGPDEPRLVQFWHPTPAVTRLVGT